MEGEFWLGLILAIPLAIIGNLFTRPIQNYLDSRIRSRALRRTRDTRQEYERVKRYREHREEFYEFMLQSLAWIGSWTAALILGVGITLLVSSTDSSFSGMSEGVRQALFVPCAFGLIVCHLGVWRWYSRVLDMAYRVRNFSEYESRVKPTLESEEQE
jgi:hypothetical protein